MTQEEYEAKVQSMPKELQNQFRQSLEINLSKRIVNRFMSTVMQAYAQGQRTVQTGEGSQNAAYMRGAQDMKDALKVASDMGMTDVDYYFGIKCFVDCYPRMLQILEMSADHILDATSKYKAEKARKDEEQVKSNVKTIADHIGVEKLCEIADEIRKQKAADGDCLPF